MKVPLVDLAAQHQEIADEIAPQLQDVLECGAFIGGPAVAEFEQEYAKFVGVEHVVGVGNGTDALELALRAAGVGPGDEVILPANTFIATAEAVSRIGADAGAGRRRSRVPADRPDCRARRRSPPGPRRSSRCTCSARPRRWRSSLDLAEAHGVAIIEDAAQSQGATRLGRPAGGFGAVAGTSFYPGKNLGAAGDAGAVLTNDAGDRRAGADHRGHGSDRKYVHDLDRRATPGWTPSRPWCCGRSCAGWRRGTTCADRPRRATTSCSPTSRGPVCQRPIRQRGRLAPVRGPGRRARPSARGACSRPGSARASTTLRRYI